MIKKKLKKGLMKSICTTIRVNAIVPEKIVDLTLEKGYHVCSDKRRNGSCNYVKLFKLPCPRRRKKQ